MILSLENGLPLPDGYHPDGGVSSFRGDPWSNSPGIFHGREVPSGPVGHVAELAHRDSSNQQSMGGDIKPTLTPVMLTGYNGKVHTAVLAVCRRRMALKFENHHVD